MARGFESKSVESQQEQAAAPPHAGKTPSEAPGVQVRRRRLELSRSDIQRRLETAVAEGHREMLHRALAALDEEIASLR